MGVQRHPQQRGTAELVEPALGMERRQLGLASGPMLPPLPTPGDVDGVTSEDPGDELVHRVVVDGPVRPVRRVAAHVDAPLLRHPAPARTSARSTTPGVEAGRPSSAASAS